MYRRFDAVVAVSAPLHRELRAAGVPDRGLHVVQNAWTPAAPRLDRRQARETLTLPDTGFVVGWVARMTPEKGGELLLRAMAKLDDLPLTVSVIGDGPELAELRRAADRLGIGDRIHWHGSVAHAGRLFSAFDCFVLSAHTEGTPIVLFEAMEAQVPIVATSVGGVPDVVSPEEALLVGPNDAGGLARAVRATCEDRSSAQARAGRARRRLAEAFAVEPWLARYEAIYREAITRRRGEGRRK
jgi:glycosyltransferase involved in cell wall biosynthesis